MNKQFEEWLKANAIYKDFMYKVPFSMQWGVYLEFFDSVGVTINPLWRFDDGYGFIIIDQTGHHTHGYYDVKFNSVCQDCFWKTRTEAQQEAIKKAFEILENEQNS